MHHDIIMLNWLKLLKNYGMPLKGGDTWLKAQQYFSKSSL